VARTDIVRLHPGLSGETIKTRAVIVEHFDAEMVSPVSHLRLQYRGCAPDLSCAFPSDLATFLVECLNQFVVRLLK
jgi:hypothetical protein